MKVKALLAGEIDAIGNAARVGRARKWATLDGTAIHMMGSMQRNSEGLYTFINEIHHRKHLVQDARQKSQAKRHLRTKWKMIQIDKS
ncbi:hypothetical protein T07_1598 [Trichinella nelsoni]|uniref:Uncharacterized protein n=1 Tax=Trichinella nelsoni TaxID=6336 RepID=A0A0V0RTT3_9BILA|nr:hypothetical protein T07_1598 [Trichinella nelsoni]